jgi:hypothetical protein
LLNLDPFLLRLFAAERLSPLHPSSFIISASPPPTRFALESRCFSRIAWPLGRCRPPTVLAMGQNRQKTGKAYLLPPSTSSGRMGPE